MTPELQALKFFRWLKRLKHESGNWLKHADFLAEEFSTAEKQQWILDLNHVIRNLHSLEIWFLATMEARK